MRPPIVPEQPVPIVILTSSATPSPTSDSPRTPARPTSCAWPAALPSHVATLRRLGSRRPRPPGPPPSVAGWPAV